MSDCPVPSLIRILAFGEILWDMLPSGKKLGGAPVNFLYHAQTLGAEVRALTRIGNDELGHEIQKSLETLKLSQQTLQISFSAPTGVVKVSLDAHGVPSYTIVENVAWDEIQIDSKTLDDIIRFLTAPKAKSAFYFGSLALRSKNNRHAVARILQALPSTVLRVCDLNLRAPFYDRETIEFTLSNSDVFKLNDVEALELDQMFADVIPQSLASFGDASGSLAESLRRNFSQTQTALRTWADRWLNTFDLKTVVLTCGSDGAFLFSKDSRSYAPSCQVEVKDSVGAGDSFAAVCLVGLLQGRSSEVIISAASQRAAFVCSQEGGTPIVPQDLLAPFDK